MTEFPIIAQIKTLSAETLTLKVSPALFNVDDTAQLLAQHARQDFMWVAQAAAKNAAQFGLNLQQKGFNVLALGSAGTGRTTMMLNAMEESAKKSFDASALTDLIALYQFDTQGKPLFLKLPIGAGHQLKLVLDKLIRQIAKFISTFVEEKYSAEILDKVKLFVATEFLAAEQQCVFIAQMPVLQTCFNQMRQEFIEYLEAWQPNPLSEADAHLENILSEAFLGRFRVNLLVSNADATKRPVIVDQDPSLHSLFGGVESASESSNIPDFLRLKAGHLLRADGGMCLLHLRDILADDQNGAQILEKLHRFCRNNTLQIEDLSSSSNQGASFISAQAAIPVQVKLVLIATREDYYELLEEIPDFFSFFPIKVEFAEHVVGNAQSYGDFALFVANKTQVLATLPFNAKALALLCEAMHRLEEDQFRMSTQLAHLEKLLVESHAMALLEQASFVTDEHVKRAVLQRYSRNAYIEQHSRASIVDRTLMIDVAGEKIGKINALTHIDLVDASFGSPVRVTANCYAGARGVVTIDREVRMSGPTHDKGVLILQSWLHQFFAEANPLNLTASIVFEQEYQGVDGDSASCAELFALLSALAKLPISQGFAVTGAMNQHGDVLPVGGLNDKIEGYFRVCQAMGLNGQQGVLIPESNARHLMLSEEVIHAVKNKQFHIMTMQHVLEGATFLMQTTVASLYALAMDNLQQFKHRIELNQPSQKMIQ